MVADAMIIPVCPFCDKPLVGFDGAHGYSLTCHGADGHMYGAIASDKTEAYKIVAAPQKILAEALSARIALPIEQRRHNKARQRICKLLFYVQQVHDKFKKDIEQGYKTRDKEYAIDMLGKALEEP